jgi:hypothetical protein
LAELEAQAMLVRRLELTDKCDEIDILIGRVGKLLTGLITKLNGKQLRGSIAR